MAVYCGSDKIKEVYCGNESIKEIYCGSDLVWQKPSGEIILFESSTPGTYSFEITERTTIFVELVGGGGGGYYTQTTGYEPDEGIGAGGGSGAYNTATWTVEPGTCTIVVGSGGKSVLTNYKTGDGQDSTISISPQGYTMKAPKGTGTTFARSGSGKIVATAGKGGSSTGVTKKGNNGSTSTIITQDVIGKSVYPNASLGYGQGGYIYEDGHSGYAKVSVVA